MSQVGAPRHASIPISNPAAPSLARGPGPLARFARRNERFCVLTPAHGLAPDLVFLDALSEIQHRVQNGLAPVEMPAPDALARTHGSAPLDRGRFTPDLAAGEQRNDLRLEPVAHDVASRRLDFLATGLRRGGVNHVLLG